jgi:hypothetical protein
MRPVLLDYPIRIVLQGYYEERQSPEDQPSYFETRHVRNEYCLARRYYLKGSGLLFCTRVYVRSVRADVPVLVGTAGPPRA